MRVNIYIYIYMMNTLCIVQVYAIIKEQGGQQGVTVCSSEGVHGGSMERERPVYLSTTSAVEIRILTTRSTKDSTGGYFMLRYQREYRAYRMVGERGV